MHEGVVAGPARAGRLAGRRRGGDHRPGLRCWPAHVGSAAARLPRLDRGLGRGAARGEGAGRPGHRRGHPAPPAAHRRRWPTATTRCTRSTRRCAPAADVAALRAALADGVIDVVATDHAPHAAQDKETEWAAARPGHARAADRAVGGGATRWWRPGCSTGAGVAERDVGAPGRGSAGWPTTAGRSRWASRPTWCWSTRPPGGPCARPRWPAAPQHARTRAASCRAGWSRPSCAADADRRCDGKAVRAMSGTRCWCSRTAGRSAARRYGAVGADASARRCSPPAMTGYQETLTDPSYHRQIVVQTAPQIGNTGVERRGRRVRPDPGGRLRGARPGPRARRTGGPAGRWPTSWTRQGVVGVGRCRHPRADPAPARARRDAGRGVLAVRAADPRRRCWTGCGRRRRWSVPTSPAR